MAAAVAKVTDVVTTLDASEPTNVAAAAWGAGSLDEHVDAVQRERAVLGAHDSDVVAGAEAVKREAGRGHASFVVGGGNRYVDGPGCAGEGRGRTSERRGSPGE